MKTHPDGRPWEYPWDSWRDGPHFSASYLRRMVPAGDADAELIKALLALQRYVVHISRTAEERGRRLVAGGLASISSFPAES